MYFPAAVALVLAASGALALPAPTTENAAGNAAENAAPKVLVKVDLPGPDNWLTNSSLFPGNLIAAYHAGLASGYNASSWNAYILKECRRYEACTSTASYQGTNSGSTGGRYWYGEVYRGGPTTPANYERVTDPAFGITESQMYTIKA